jgi:hypothetical protein
MNWRIPKHALGSSSPQSCWGNRVQNVSSRAAGFSSYSRRWPWTSNTNSSPPTSSMAASGDVVASGETW